MSREVMLRKAYETCYGIHNHYAAGQKPFDRVKARRKEEVFLYSDKIKDYQRFIDLGMASLTGMGMDAFFKLPYAEVEALFNMARHVAKKENAGTAELERQLKEALAAAKSNE